MSFGSSHVVVIKLGSFNTIVDVVPYNIYLLSNGSTSGSSNISIDNYYSNENILYFPTKIYGSESNSSEFSLEKSETFSIEAENFIKKDKIINKEHFKQFLNLLFDKISSELTEKVFSVFVVSSFNITSLNKTFDLLMEYPYIKHVRFVPVYLSLLYNFPMGNYLQQHGGDSGSSVEDTYDVAGGLGKLYQEFIMNNDLSLTTTNLPNQIVNSNVTTNPILLQHTSYVASFQTTTGFQGNSLIIDIGYKETKFYFIEHFKNLRNFETTLSIGCFDIIEDIKRSVQNGSDDVDVLLASGWVDFQLDEALYNGLNQVSNRSNEEEYEEELDVAKILASGEVDISSKTLVSANKERIEGKVIKYSIGESDAITKLVKAAHKVSTLKTSANFPDVLSFSKMLENVVIAGSVGRSKSFKDALVQMMKYEFQPKSIAGNLPNVNPFIYDIKYVHPATYFPNWKEENFQQLPVTRSRNNRNTFDSEMKGALIVSRYAFDQLVTLSNSQYSNTYNGSVFDGILSFSKFSEA
ncbi:hypothetical protein QEN19_002765 [Hanseniaspora menglaensis]